MLLLVQGHAPGRRRSDCSLWEKETASLLSHVRDTLLPSPCSSFHSLAILKFIENLDHSMALLVP